MSDTTKSPVEITPNHIRRLRSHPTDWFAMQDAILLGPLLWEVVMMGIRNLGSDPSIDPDGWLVGTGKVLADVLEGEQYTEAYRASAFALLSAFPLDPGDWPIEDGEAAVTALRSWVAKGESLSDWGDVDPDGDTLIAMLARQKGRIVELETRPTLDEATLYAGLIGAHSGLVGTPLEDDHPHPGPLRNWLHARREVTP